MSTNFQEVTVQGKACSKGMQPGDSMKVELEAPNFADSALTASKNPGLIPLVLLHLVEATGDAFSWGVMEMLYYFMQVYHSILMKVS